MQNALNRWIFILGSVFIVTLIFFNTYSFFQELKQNERNKMHIWAEAQKELMNDDPEAVFSETALSVIRTNSSTPMISYSYIDSIYESRNIDTTNFAKKRTDLINQFASEYVPIDIMYEGEVIETIYYGNSPLINKLKFYPALLILIILLFFLALYFFYKTSKSAEQNRLWAGMAKETAHQIGTPLSSLVGWTEILKSENVNPSYIVEMEKDVDRLKTITERFSKIGSLPALQKADLVYETSHAFNYLKSRSSKLIEFELDIPEAPIYVMLNPQLFGWTIENLVKNGIDAMKGKGKITISITTKEKKASVQVSDTGKGISKRNQKQIFQPGFTTKKRGWGLGLSLAKRIIEEYHNGKIHVLKSTPKIGTTMEIEIKRLPN